MALVINEQRSMEFSEFLLLRETEIFADKLAPLPPCPPQMALGPAERPASNRMSHSTVHTFAFYIKT